MAEEQEIINGLNVGQLKSAMNTFKNEPELSKFRFYVTNKWISGGHNRTIVEDFYGLRRANTRKNSVVIEVDEPPALMGNDQGASPVEHLLNALAACVTSSIVYHAAALGIKIEELESSLEGDLDIRGFLGLSDEARPGYQNIRIYCKVKSDGSPEKLKELSKFSPVFDMVSKGVPITIEVEKK